MASSPAEKLSVTGVEGLDEILKGGLPEGRLYLLKGEPGAGKTTLALQYLLEGARRGERSLYITLSETRDEVNAVARSHGWNLAQIDIFELSSLADQLASSAEDTLFHPSELELNRTTQLLLNEIGNLAPKRLVLDSLSELRLLADTSLRYRRQMLAFKQYFSGKDTTVLFLDDHTGGGGDLHVQSIAHGVLTIEQLETDYGVERRRVKINKLRGVNFIGGFHDAVIFPGGLQVFPRLIPSQHLQTFDAGKVESGITHLDTLLGGGLDRGTSVLLLGPAGSGKSTIALQYALATAKRGERAYLYLFEENVRTLLGRAASIGMELQPLIDSGHLILLPIDPSQLAPGQFVHLVKEHVQKEGARLVLIDSLNGYMQAMPDVKFLTIQLHELLAFLSHNGVVSLLTVAQHGIVGQMNTPVDLTYLADTVILMRYFEQAGRIRKAISVIKKRIGGHEETIREFKFSRDGLVVGAALEEFHGVLTGTPTFKGTSAQMLTKK